jgi:branched-chain amino acid transport system substrate-binding protein
MVRRQQWRRTILATAGVLSLVLVTAACGGASGEPGESAAPSLAPYSGPAASGEPVKLGVISSDSTPSGTTVDISTTVEQWVDYTNSHGGVGGHPVEVVYKDDQANPALAKQAAQSMISDDNVVAIADNSYVSASFADVAADAKVPILGLNGSTANTIYESNANYFASQNTTPSGSTFLIADMARIAGVKKLAMLYCAEVAACAGSTDHVKKYAEEMGIEVSYAAPYSASTPNYTAQCLAARDAGADGLYPVGPSSSANLRVLTDCAKQGYEPAALGSGSTVGTEIFDPANGITVVWAGSGMLHPQLRVPENEVFHAVMDDFLPQSTSPTTVMGAWVGLEMFKAAAAQLSTSPVPADIYKGLYSFQGETLGGLASPLTFVEGQPTPNRCHFAIKSDNGKISSPEGPEAICYGAE